MIYYGSPANIGTQDSMAKKKRGLSKYKQAKKNSNIVSKSKANPPPLKDVMDFVIPGFAGYAGTRMTSRIVHGMVIKRFPKMAKHASVLSTGLAATAAWFAVHRIDRFKQYHTPVVVGAAIAAVQTAVQAYLPKYGWMVSDHNMDVLPAASSPQKQKLVAGSTSRTSYPARKLPKGSKAFVGGADLPPPIASMSAEDVAVELDDLDMGSLASDFDVDGMGGMSDMDLDDLMDDSIH